MTSPLHPPTSAPAPAGAVVGIDAASPTTRAADELAHRVRDLIGIACCPVVIATHFVRGHGLPHVALTVEAAGADLTALGDFGAGLWTDGASSGPHELVAGAAQAVQAYRARHGGRAVYFAGSDAVAAELTVSDLLADTAIDAVTLLSGGEIDPVTVLLTRGHLRPTWATGRLVLAVERAARGRVVPFETPNPTPCCADHA